MSDIKNENLFLAKQLEMINAIQDGDNETTWADFTDEYNRYYDKDVAKQTCRQGFFLMRNFLENGWVRPPDGSDGTQGLTNGRKTITNNKDGSQTVEDSFEIDDEAQLRDKNYLLRMHGYDPMDWEVVGSKHSLWKSSGGKTLCSSKLSVKPKSGFSLSDIDTYFESKTFSSSPPLTVPTCYDPSGEILEIALPDLHAGLLSWSEETSENYDIQILKERFNSCINDIVERSSGRKFKEILLVTLGDVLHVDGDDQKTSKGTFQQVDSRMSKIFDITLDMFIETVEALGNIAPTRVIYVSGNHDRLLGYTLIKALSKAFRKDENIMVDTSPNPRKFRRYENVLIGWTHGDCNKNNMAEWLQSEARTDYGLSLYSEVHSGHFHSTITYEKSGMIIRHLPTICSSSAWEHQQAYNKGVKTVVSFVWNPKNGLREMWYSNI